MIAPKMRNSRQMRAALLKIAEGLRDELAGGHLGTFVPPGVERRIEALAQLAWDALGHPSVVDAERIRRKAAESDLAR